MPGVHAKIRETNKSSGKYLLCPQDFITKCLSKQSQRAANRASACTRVCKHVVNQADRQFYITVD